MISSGVGADEEGKEGERVGEMAGEGKGEGEEGEMEGSGGERDRRGEGPVEEGEGRKRAREREEKYPRNLGGAQERDEVALSDWIERRWRG